MSSYFKSLDKKKAREQDPHRQLWMDQYHTIRFTSDPYCRLTQEGKADEARSRVVAHFFTNKQQPYDGQDKYFWDMWVELNVMRTKSTSIEPMSHKDLEVVNSRREGDRQETFAEFARRIGWGRFTEENNLDEEEHIESDLREMGRVAVAVAPDILDEYQL